MPFLPTFNVHQLDDQRSINAHTILQLFQIRSTLDMIHTLALQLAMLQAIGIHDGLMIIGTLLDAVGATHQGNLFELATFHGRDALPFVQLKAGNATIHTAPVPFEIGTKCAVLGGATRQATALTAITNCIAAKLTAVGGTALGAGWCEVFLGRVHVPAIFSTIRAIGIIGCKAIADGTMIGRFVVLKKELINY